MTKLSLKQKLRNGDIVFGPWCVIPSAAVMNITASAGFDFAIIDLEHGATSFETAEDMARAATSVGCHPIIRLGSIHEESILKSLDIGVEGVITAHVESGADARTAVECCKYFPLGKRGFSPFTRAGGYSGGEIARHAEIQNDNTLVGVILEGKKGIEALDDVLQTEHLDLIYIGAYDLSQALGVPGQVNHPEVRAYMETCIKKIRNAGIAPGGYVARTEADIRWMVDIGMQFITYLPDCAAIHQSFCTAVDMFKTVTTK